MGDSQGPRTVQLTAFELALRGLHDVSAVERVDRPGLDDLRYGFVVVFSTGRRAMVRVTREFWLDVPASEIGGVLAHWPVADALAVRDEILVTTVGLDPPIVACESCGTRIGVPADEPRPYLCVTCRPSGQPER